MTRYPSPERGSRRAVLPLSVVRMRSTSRPAWRAASSQPPAMARARRRRAGGGQQTRGPAAQRRENALDVPTGFEGVALADAFDGARQPDAVDWLQKIIDGGSGERRVGEEGRSR